MIIKIYDNPEVFDRYTVIIDDAVYAMSKNALEPDGFNQYSMPAIDLEISTSAEEIYSDQWRNLPAQVLASILLRIVDESA